MRINGRFNKVQRQAQLQLVPTWDELTAVLLRVTGSPPAAVMAAMERLKAGRAAPGDQALADAWVKPYSGQIWAAWDKAYPRWAECPIWAEKRAERAAHEQV